MGSFRRHWSNMPSDLLLASRRLVRSPAASLATVLALSLGIAAGTFFVLIVDGFLFPTVRSPNAERLVRFALVTDEGVAEFAVLSNEVINTVITSPLRMVTQLSAYGHAVKPVAIRGQSHVLAVEGVRGSFFEAVRARSLLGRTLRDYDTASEARTAVLSERLWRAQLNSDPGVIGEFIQIGGVSAKVVGIISDPFRGLDEGAGGADVWVSGALIYPTRLFGVLPSTTGFEQARDEIEERFGRITNYDLPRGLTLRRGAIPARPPAAFVLSGAAILVSLLLITAIASGLVGLFGARLLGRHAEIAVRQALGAESGDILRMLALEAAIIVGISTAVGAYASTELSPLALAALLKSLPIPLGIPVSFDWLAFCYVAIAATLIWLVIVATLSGLLLRSDLLPSTQRGLGGSTSQNLSQRSRLISVQLAAAAALVVVAALFVRTSVAEIEVSVGFEAKGAAVAWLNDGSETAYGRLNRVIDEMRRKMPDGLIASGDSLPGDGRGRSDLYWPSPMSSARSVTVRTVSPGYFAAIGLPLRFGRVFASQESGSTAVVSETIAREIAGAHSSIGTILNVGVGAESRAVSVIGVVADSKGRADPQDRSIYVAFDSSSGSEPLAIVLRGPNAVARLDEVLREAIKEQPDGISLMRVAPLQDEIGRSSPTIRLVARVLTFVGGVAAIIVLVSLYGIFAHLALLRRREVAIRRALGATHAEIYRQIVFEAAKSIGQGVFGGVLLALLAAPFIRHYIWALRSTDLAAFVVVPALLSGFALAASLLPYRRLLREPLTNRNVSGQD
jgi:putative ABC transport system permease protein